MGDIYIGRNDDEEELMHYGRGAKKANAKYTNRYMRNGKWVYEYGVNSAKRLESQARTHERAMNSDMATSQKYAHQLTTRKMSRGNTRATAKKVRAYGMSAKGHRESAAALRGQANKAYGKAYTQARNAARLVTSDADYQKALKKRARNAKLQGKINKGRKKVNELLSRIRNSASSVATQVSNKRSQMESARKSANVQKALNKGLKSKSKAYKRKRKQEARQEQFDSAVNTVKKTATNAYNSAANTASNAKKAASDTYKKKKKAAKRSYKKFERKALAAQRAYRSTQ